MGFQVLSSSILLCGAELAHLNLEGLALAVSVLWADPVVGGSSWAGPDHSCASSVHKRHGRMLRGQGAVLLDVMKSTLLITHDSQVRQNNFPCG